MRMVLFTSESGNRTQDIADALFLGTFLAVFLTYLLKPNHGRSKLKRLKSIAQPNWVELIKLN